MYFRKDGTRKDNEDRVPRCVFLSPVVSPGFPPFLTTFSSFFSSLGHYHTMRSGRPISREKTLLFLHGNHRPCMKILLLSIMKLFRY